MNMIVDALIVWRLTHLIQAEDGPFDLIFKFHLKLKQLRVKSLSKLFNCFQCFSVWAGISVALIRLGLHWTSLTYGIALSGAAILLQFISGDH